MNSIIESLYQRKSIRVFEEKEISSEDKELILTAATMAPTAGNQQLYTILDITDPELKQQLSVTCDNQPFIAKAKLVLIFCADFQKWYDAFLAADCEPRKPAEGDLLLAVNDAVIAAQNAVVAAESLGIGSCYIGDIMEHCELHREMLHLPEYVFPTAMLVFGYPTKQQLERTKPERGALKHIVHENGYRHMDGTELQELFDKKKGANTYEGWIQAFCNRKYNSDFSIEMSRSVAKYLEAFQKDTYDTVTDLLIQKNLKIATMESCTSGLLASTITDFEGASAIFKGSIIAYANETKIMEGVPKEIIATYGVYSAECAQAMAKCAKEKYDSDISIGITGSFANVDPNNADSVAGVIYYHISYPDAEIDYTLTYDNISCSRKALKQQTVNDVLSTLRTRLADM